MNCKNINLKYLTIALLITIVFLGCSTLSSFWSGGTSKDSSPNIEGEWINTQNFFKEAIQAYQKGEMEQSITLLSNLLTQNTSVELLPLVYFNMGIVHEKQQKYLQAVSNYQKALELAYNSEFKKENLRRILRCHEKQGKWQDGLGVLKQLALVETDSLQQKINQVRKTYLLVMLEQINDAQKNYNQIDFSFWNQEKEDPISKFYQAQLRALDVLFELKNYLALTLSLPENLLKAKFEAKIEKVITLENLILKIFMTKQPYWSLKGLTLLGMIYQDLFFQVSNLPADPRLDLEEQQVFHYELQKQLLPLLRRSVLVFEKQIELLKKSNHDPQIVNKSILRLNEVRDMIETLQNRRLVIYTKSALDSQNLMKLESLDEH